eukprot:10361337-Ditylum_brightwellii.AAC.2
MEVYIPQHSNDDNGEDEDDFQPQTEGNKHSLQHDNKSDSKEDKDKDDNISYKDNFFDKYDQEDLLQLIQAYPDQNRNIQKFYAVRYNTKRIEDFLTMTAKVAPKKP